MKSIVVGGTLLLSTAAMAQFDFNEDRDLQQYRFRDQRGINQFEALDMGREYDGHKVRLGGALAIQFQGLQHSTGSSDSLGLAGIGPNFNLPTANLDLDVALHEGVRMHLRTYLSSRHHPESWVKGGYIQIGKLDFIKPGFLEGLMDITTVKMGLMEINYGDYHFRRTDNARAVYNPFVGNLIMDAFNTEAAAELYVTPGDFLFMAGITNGNLNQSVSGAPDQTPAFLGKAGWDKQFTEDIRFRLTASGYTTALGQQSYLYDGDRAGSRYYFVMEPQGASASGNFRSGRFNPEFGERGFGSEVTSFMINPFIQYKGFEFLGTYENTTGRRDDETDSRNFTQLHGELLYRFGGESRDFYVGGKYNSVMGEMRGTGNDITIDRMAFAAGWYMTPNMMLKAEYVMQNYDGFAEADLRHEGSFDGMMLEAVISF